MRYLTRPLLISLLLIAAATSSQAVPSTKFANPITYNVSGNLLSSTLGDVNGDGKLDMVVGSCPSSGCTIDVMLGNGDGTFQAPISSSYGGGTIVLADVNGDGKLDILVADTCVNTGNCSYETAIGGVAVLLGNGDGTFQAPVSYSSGSLSCGVTALAVADLNGDGNLDVVLPGNDITGGDCTGFGADAVVVLLGNGDGTFQTPIVSHSVLVLTQFAIADLNGDGYPDLAVTTPCNKERDLCGGDGFVGVMLGNGDGTFQTPVDYSVNNAGPFGYAVAIADLNGDGKLDLVVATECDAHTPDCGTSSYLGRASVLLGNGDGTFQTAVLYNTGGSQPGTIAVADVNGDGKPDLVVANFFPGGHEVSGQTGEVGVLLGNGDGTFQAPARYKSGGPATVSVTIGDLNGDGRADIVAMNAQANTTGCGDYGANSFGCVGVLLNEYEAVTTTTITASPNPSQVNQPVTFTATISSSSIVPNGSTVTFYNGTGFSIGTGTTTNGVATLTTSFSKAKSYTIKASFAGGIYLKASKGTVKQTVN